MGDWWRGAVFYEIYISSFYDSNNDGIGDLKGITLKLDYLSELGIDAIWLTPFYESPKVDNGYDISDFIKIDSDYGSMDDFEVLIQEAHSRNIKVIVDVILNHTSTKHPWFLESKSSIDNSKRDWYLWETGRAGSLPNNWESFFSGSAWEFDVTTKAYYYHAFSKEQADLNWSNPEVINAMFGILKFWLEKGVDGFRLDVINFLTTNGILEDNPYDENNIQIHKFDVNQKDIYSVIGRIRKYIDTFDNKVLIGEVGSEDFQLINSFQGNKLLDIVFNFNLGSIEKFDLEKIFRAIKQMDGVMDKDLPTLFFGSHDMARVASRFELKNNNEAHLKNIATLMLTARGVPFIYFGEEIGMKNLSVDSIENMNDIQGVTAYETAISKGENPLEALTIANSKCRDKSRNPMLWNNDKYAGFSNHSPWISVLEAWNKNNVLNQMDSTSSIFTYYKKLLSFRGNSDPLTSGDYKVLGIEGDVVFYHREYNNENVFVIINFGSINIPLYTFGFTCKWIMSSLRNQIEDLSIYHILGFESLIGVK